jgi:hypothetical protein
MTKAAIVVLAGTEGHENLGRITNALQAAKEFHEGGDELKLIFDGAGTEWTEELEDESHDLNELYRELSDRASACSFCSDAFEIESEIEQVDEYEGHPSFKDLIDEGYEVITF